MLLCLAADNTSVGAVPSGPPGTISQPNTHTLEGRKSCAHGRPVGRPDGRPGRPSRLQAFDAPAVGAAPVDEPVVQAVLAALPELDALQLHAVPAPERWSGYRGAPVLGFELVQPALKLLPARYGPTLFGGPGPELAAAGSAPEVGVRLFGRDLASEALDPDLPLELAPVEDERARGGWRRAPSPCDPRSWCRRRSPARRSP